MSDTIHRHPPNIPKPGIATVTLHRRLRKLFPGNSMLQHKARVKAWKHSGKIACVNGRWYTPLPSALMQTWKMLPEYPEWIGYWQLAEKLGLTPRALSGRLRRLLAQKLVVRQGRGRWSRLMDGQHDARP